MKELFGSYKDEYDRLYQEVYRNELQDIQRSLVDVKDIFNKQELSAIVKYLLYDCFGDTVSLDNKVCKRIVEQLKNLE